MSDIAKMIAIAKRFGGGSGPSEVVILPETEVPGGFAETQIPITTPLSATPTAGATAKVTYNGTEYISPIIQQVEEDGLIGYVVGNTDAAGLPGGNPDAPFVVALDPAGKGGMYGVIFPLEDVPSITLSIVQTEGAASGGESAGGYMYITGMAEDSEADSTNVTMSMPFEVVLAAVHSGKPVFCALHNFKGDTLIYVLQVTGYSDWAVLFVVDLGQNHIEMMWTEANGCVASFLS